jgi:hypothetical protein
MAIKTIVTCDKCGKEIPQVNVNYLNLKGTNKSYSIKWELCDICYEKIEKLLLL